MPRKDIDYSKSIIYKIQHIDNPEILYVGSSTDFIRRKQLHKHNCHCETSNSYNLKLYKTIRENGGWDLFKIMIVKEFNCNSKIELLIEEDRIMNDLKSNLNIKRAHITDEEKKEYYKQHNIHYYLKNKEKIKQKYEENHEKILQKKKEYREVNKEKIKESQAIIITCDCGCKINTSSKTKHEKTKKHINLIQNKTN